MTQPLSQRSTHPAPVPSERRGECPTLARPMQTGDGLLARLRPVDTVLTFPQLRALAEAAARFGNGILEITARGSLQVRGLKPDTVGPFEDAVLASGIEISTGVGIETPPLAGLDADELIDIRRLAGELRQRIAGHRPPLVLAPKLAITFDGGGRFHLGSVSADVKVTAFREGERTKFLLSIGGGRRGTELVERPSVLPDISPTGEENSRGGDLGPQSISSARHATVNRRNDRATIHSPPLWGRWPAGLRGAATRAIAVLEQDQIIDAVMDVLERLAAIGPAARGKDLDLPLIDGPPLTVDPSPLVGVFSPPSVHDDTAILGLALAYRQASADALIAFANAAESVGAQDVRLAPDHGLFVTGLTHGQVQELRQVAAASGFLTDTDDPRRNIALCAGSKGCASAFYDTGDLAAKLLRHAPDLLDGSVGIHLSGCAKGCARPAPAAITLVGARGGYGLVANGAASDAPAAYIAENHIDTALQRLQALMRQSKEDGESVRACLSRLGADGIAAALQLDET